MELDDDQLNRLNEFLLLNDNLKLFLVTYALDAGFHEYLDINVAHKPESNGIDKNHGVGRLALSEIIEFAKYYDKSFTIAKSTLVEKMEKMIRQEFIRVDHGKDLHKLSSSFHQKKRYYSTDLDENVKSMYRFVLHGCIENSINYKDIVGLAFEDHPYFSQNSNRVRIIDSLSDRGKNPSEISRETNISKDAVISNLNTLKDKGIVSFNGGDKISSTLQYKISESEQKINQKFHSYVINLMENFGDGPFTITDVQNVLGLTEKNAYYFRDIMLKKNYFQELNRETKGNLCKLTEEGNKVNENIIQPIICYAITNSPSQERYKHSLLKKIKL